LNIFYNVSTVGGEHIFVIERTNNHRHSSSKGQLPPASIRSRPPWHRFTNRKTTTRGPRKKSDHT